MLNQDIISEYLANRDRLNADFNQRSLFAPQAANPGTGFVPRPFEPQTARLQPIANAIAASPSLVDIDPGTFGVGWNGAYLPPDSPEFTRTLPEIAMEYLEMGGPIGGMVRGGYNTLFGGPNVATGPDTWGIDQYTPQGPDTWGVDNMGYVYGPDTSNPDPYSGPSFSDIDYSSPDISDYGGLW